jgi:hypothetical protein
VTEPINAGTRILADANMVLGLLFEKPAEDLRQAAVFLQSQAIGDTPVADVVGLLILMLERLSSGAALFEREHPEEPDP